MYTAYLPREISIVLEEIYDKIHLCIIIDESSVDFSKLILVQVISLFFIDPKTIIPSKGERGDPYTWEKILTTNNNPLAILRSILPQNVLNDTIDYQDILDQEKFNKIDWGEVARKLTEDKIWVRNYLENLSQETTMVDFSVFDIIKFISRSHRSRLEDLGQIYTPYCFASKLSEKVIKSWFENPSKKEKSEKRIKLIQELKILDPTTGGSVFLIACGNILYDLYQTNKSQKDKNLTKVSIVKNNLYGVDTDPIAILISKIKLWLWSYNLDHTIFRSNIHMGNSLFGYQSISSTQEANYKLNPLNTQFNLELEQRQPVYNLPDELNINNKDSLSEIINSLSKSSKFEYIILEGNRISWTSLKLILDDDLITKIKFSEAPLKKFVGYAIFSSSLTEEELEAFSLTLGVLQVTKINNLFHWSDFNLGEDKKFDIIVGNPPFIALTDLPLIMRMRLNLEFPEIYSGNNDISYFFLLRCLKGLILNGFLAFILPKYLLQSVYGASVRKIIQKTTQIQEIHDFMNISLFNNVQINTMVLILRKNALSSPNIFHFYRYQKIQRKITGETFKINQASLKPEKWIIATQITSEILEKINKRSNFLLNQICDISKGIETGCDKVFTSNVSNYFSKDLGIQKQNLRPWIKNKDIKPFFIEYKNREVIFAPSYREKNIMIDTNLMNYLNANKKLLFNRSRISKFFLWRKGDERSTMNWFYLKIVSPYKSKRNRFAIDRHGTLASKDVIWLIPKDSFEGDEKLVLYLLSLLNSDLYTFYAQNSIKNLGSVYEYYPKQIENFPIYYAGESNVFADLITLTKKVLENRNSEESRVQERINKLVYNLFNISSSEQEYISQYLLS